MIATFNEKIKSEKTYVKEGYIWNMVAGFISASETVVLLMIITRTNGLIDSGIVAIAFTIARLLMSIGRYGVRNYQVTDVENKFSFKTYYSARIVSVLLMAISTIGYLIYSFFWKEYSVYKILVVLIVSMIYMVESLEDVFWGAYQQNGRLDLGGKIFSFRWLVQLVVIISALIITQDILCSLLMGLLAGATLTYGLNKHYIRFFYSEKCRFAKENVIDLLKICFPLFFVLFLTNYVVNAPKYAIDKYMTEEFQAIYGFIAMPVFVIGLLNSFLYQPILVDIAVDWKEQKYDKFRTRILKQMLIIAGLTVVIIIVGYWLGIPVLSMLYSLDLAPVKTEFMILLAGGGLLAIIGFLCVIMTVIRIQSQMAYGYLGAAILAQLFSGIFVYEGGIMGAAILFITLMVVLTITFLIMVLLEYKRVMQING